MAPESNNASKTWLGLAAALGLGCIAFFPLAQQAAFVPSATEAERFFFERTQSTLLALAAAGWLAWRRRGSLAALDDRRSPTLAALLALPGLGFYTWARLVDAADLLVPALVLVALSWAVFEKGARAIRILGVPAFVACLALPLPAPIYNELVWASQRTATYWASQVLLAVGYDLEVGDIAINNQGHVFWVIETCSGLRASDLLTIMAFLVREILESPSRKSWLLVVFAIPIALLLNMLRIVSIVVLGSGQASAEDHVVQGLVAVFLGTALLFAGGYFLLPAPVSRGEQSREERRANPPRPGPFTLSTLALMALLYLGLPTWPESETKGPEVTAFLSDHAGWTATNLDVARQFLGELPAGVMVFTRYEKPHVQEGAPAKAVEIQITIEARKAERSSLAASKLAWIGPEWSSVFEGSKPLWRLGHEIDLHHAVTPRGEALVYHWTLGGRSWLEECLDSALALDRAPWRQPTALVDVRLSSQIRGDRSNKRREQAALTLEEFVEDFAPQLRSLAND